MEKAEYKESVMGKPLAGMKILDLTQYVSGSMCTLLLCDYGAEVIKIEKPQAQGGTTEEEKCARATFHRGKKSLLLNMEIVEERSVFW